MMAMEIGNTLLLYLVTAFTGHWDNIRCFGGWVTWEYTRVGGIEWYRNSNTKCHTAASNGNVPFQTWSSPSRLHRLFLSVRKSN